MLLVVCAWKCHQALGGWKQLSAMAMHHQQQAGEQKQTTAVSEEKTSTCVHSIQLNT